MGTFAFYNCKDSVFYKKTNIISTSFYIVYFEKFYKESILDLSLRFLVRKTTVEKIRNQIILPVKCPKPNSVNLLRSTIRILAMFIKKIIEINRER